MFFVWDNDRSGIFEGGRQGGQFWGYGLIRFPFCYERSEVGVPFERDTEILFEGKELVELVFGDTGCAGKLVVVSEDTELAGAASKTHVVTWMWTYAVFLQDVPDLLFFPIADGPEPIDMTEGMLSVPKVGFVRLQDGVLGSLRTLFTAFSGEDQGALVLEAGVVPECRSADINLQIGRAPADA